jgi:hypothetical protein
MTHSGRGSPDRPDAPATPQQRGNAAAENAAAIEAALHD